MFEKAKMMIRKLLADENIPKQDTFSTILSRITERPSIFFAMDIIEHCNLNCKACGSFAPLASRHFTEKDIIKKDLERLSELCSGICHHISILGGEPLLHPELLSIIEITRHCFPIGVINLVTNGTLLLNQGEDFWEICRNNDITIAVTHYPIKINYNMIRKKVLEKKCKYVCFGVAKNYWCITGLSEQANINETKRFLECPNANSCSVLKEGKIYMCPKTARIHLLNNAFGTDFKLMDKDCIDIYKAENVKEILTFLSTPIPFCRYCSEWKMTEWDISKKDRTEWITD